MRHDVWICPDCGTAVPLPPPFLYEVSAKPVGGQWVIGAHWQDRDNAIHKCARAPLLQDRR